MGHLGQVGDKHLVAHGAAQAHGQLGTTLLEGFGTKHLAHGHHLRVVVGHLDADGSLAGHRRDDADAQGSKAQGDIIFQTTDLVHANTILGDNLKQGHRGTHMDHDFLNLDAIFAQGIANALLVLVLLLLVNTVGIHADVLQQVQGGEAIMTVFTSGIVRVAHISTGCDGFQASGLAAILVFALGGLGLVPAHDVTEPAFFNSRFSV